MMNDPTSIPGDHVKELARLREDFIDSWDEELEMEMDDDRLGSARGVEGGSTLPRRTYLRELFRLQGELVKLQDWVAHTGQKLVVIFEGRGAAGKCGVIKRITQRLNPRICRVAALPAPNDREGRSGISSATSRICPPVMKSCYSIVPGTTAQALNALWGSSAIRITRPSSRWYPNSSEC
jgi:hypothetical protein